VSQAPSSTRWIFFGLLGPYLLGVYNWWFVCDDAFITFRYSRNLAEGLGLRYNLGDHTPVEGYSNFLWMLLAAACEAIGVSPALVTPVVSTLTGVATLWLTLHILRKMGVAPALQLAGGAVLALAPPFAVWSTSGLASMPQTLGMVAAWYYLTLRDDDRAPIWAGLSALGLALVRTEGIAWALIIGILAALSRALEGKPVVRPLITYAVTLLVPYAAYFGWRANYFDAWVANTAKAKVHLTPATFLRGLRYIGLYLATLIAPAALFLAAPMALLSKHRWAATSAALLAVGVPAYAVVVSGDYMTWFRILVPGLPFMAITFALAGQTAIDRGWVPQNVGAGLLAVLALLMALPGQDLHLVPQRSREPLQVRDKLSQFRSENQQWGAMVRHADHWKEKGLALGAYAQPGERYVAAAIGNIGYFSDVFIYDRNGLVNREVAEQPWSGELRSPGHDKVVDRSFFLKMKPDILDSKLLHAGANKKQMDANLREMEAFRFRKQYYPELFQWKSPRGVRKVLLVLRRAEDQDQAKAGWTAYREQASRNPPQRSE